MLARPEAATEVAPTLRAARPRKAPTGAAPGPALSMVNVPTEAPAARVTDAMSPAAMAPELRLPGLAKSPGDAIPIP